MKSIREEVQAKLKYPNATVTEGDLYALFLAMALLANGVPLPQVNDGLVDALNAKSYG